jgi:predicted amidohydrolase
MTPFSIAGIQMDVSATENNVEAMKHRINIAMHRFSWIDMILFSELAPYGPLIHNHPDSLDADIKAFQELARQHRIWLIPGSMFERRDGKVYNTSVVINPQGEIIGKYDKMFPFMPYEMGVESGDEFLIFDVPDVGRFGL